MLQIVGLLLLFLSLSAPSHADSWGSVATISAEPTPGYVCYANSNGIDVTCNSTAPYVSATGALGIGTSSPAASALLDLTSTTTGFLPPRMTTTQMNAIASPAAGLTVYNSTDGAIEYYDGTAWWEAGSTSAAGTTGNVQYNNAGDFAADTAFNWDGTNHRLGIGTTTPGAALNIWGAGAWSDFRVNRNSTSYFTIAAPGGTNAVSKMGLNSTSILGVGATGVGIGGPGYSDGGNAYPANGLLVQGNVGIGTVSPTSLLHTYDSAAKTASYTSALINALDTSSTGTVNKIGLDVESTGTWNGTSAVNTGLVVNATGGTTNYAATFSGGNVGIGTTVPNALLSLGIGLSTIKMAVYDGPSGINMYGIGVNSGQLTFGAGIAANGTPQMVLTSGGNVGIGTTSPISNTNYGGLSLNGSTGGIISLEAAGSEWFRFATDGGGNYIQGMTNLPLRFYTFNAERMRIDSSGNVGIGTTSPASQTKLDVNGVIKVAGTGSETCSAAADIGKIRINPATGKLQVCRQ